MNLKYFIDDFCGYAEMFAILHYIHFHSFVVQFSFRLCFLSVGRMVVKCGVL